MFNRISAAAACCVVALFGVSPALASGIATTTTLTSGPAFVGTPVTLNATIVPTPASICTGNISFQVLPATPLTCTGGNPVAVAGNAAACQTTFGAPGPVSLRGVYTSTSPCSGSTSQTYVLTVSAIGVPTLGQWAMLLFAGALMISGMVVMARRSRMPPTA